MKHFAVLNILVVALVGASGFARASESPRQLCSFLDSETKIKNCIRLFDEDLVPNREALTYTIMYLRANSGGSLADPSCVRQPRGQAGEAGMDLDRLGQGIQNTCQFVINDVHSKWKGAAFQSNAYVVDLCQENDSKVVRNIYMNRGTGIKNAGGLSDTSKANTTAIGAFLTGDNVFGMIPYGTKQKKNGKLVYPKGYRKLVARMGKVHAVRVYGLHTSNNDTSYSKPIHTSDYTSSWGCPSVSSDNVWMIEALAENGPSLLMNYGSPKDHPIDSIDKCDAQGGEPVTPARESSPDDDVVPASPAPPVEEEVTEERIEAAHAPSPAASATPVYRATRGGLESAKNNGAQTGGQR